MGIFGKLDAANIPSNPNFVEKGTYEAELTNAYVKTTSQGAKQLHLSFKIEEPESLYDGKYVTKFYFLVDDDMTQADFDNLPAEDKAKILKNVTTMKKDLCGTPNNSYQKGLGQDPEDLNDPNWKPEVLKGLKVRIGVSNYGDEGVAVNWMNLLSE